MMARPNGIESNRDGLTIVEFLIVGAILWTVAEIAVPTENWRSQGSVEKYACFQNQATITEALASFERDEGNAFEVIAPGTLRQLQKLGYIQQVPEDPGGGLGSTENYQVSSFRCGGGQWRGITCRVHGTALGSANFGRELFSAELSKQRGSSADPVILKAIRFAEEEIAWEREKLKQRSFKDGLKAGIASSFFFLLAVVLVSKFSSLVRDRMRRT